MLNGAHQERKLKCSAVEREAIVRCQECTLSRYVGREIIDMAEKQNVGLFAARVTKVVKP